MRILMFAMLFIGIEMPNVFSQNLNYEAPQVPAARSNPRIGEVYSYPGGPPTGSYEIQERPVLLPDGSTQIQQVYVWRPIATDADANQLQRALNQYKSTPEDSPQRAAIRAEVAQLLGQQYDQHLAAQVKQMADLENRLEKLREQLERRQAAKTKLVELKLELLLSQADGLGWPEAPPSGPFGSTNVGDLGGATTFFPGTANILPTSSAPVPSPQQLAALPPGEVRSHLFESDMKLNAMKHVLLAIHNYESAYMQFPFLHQAGKQKADQIDLSWMVRILPYMDEAELFSQFDLDQSWDSEQNRPLLDKIPAILGKGQQTQIRWVESDVKKFADITDGSSNTIALIYGGPPVIWTENKSLTQYEALELFTSLKPEEELIVGMYDGSVKQITRAYGTQTFQAMLTPAGGETITRPPGDASRVQPAR